ncbi:MaoC family dehydratase [Aeromicrobium sp. Leaf350]|uniref:MaoC family dehydratase n=1 Tax=Aeromicrobium sp. Leaf350 TaxID=2876565 RepID=UPI002714B09D|nr:MaoC family dehydratase [Aeromicrobium sp. Leaf350]
MRAQVGQVLGVSDWLEVTQERIDLFADATGDHQWIHVDPERAKSGPFGATIAHGFLTVSLLPVLTRQTYQISGERLAVNYGLDRVRFPSPVRCGDRIRGEVTLAAVRDVPDGIQATYRTVVSVDGRPKPACVADSLVRYAFEESQEGVTSG